jgi:hypothetical protein
MTSLSTTIEMWAVTKTIYLSCSSSYTACRVVESVMELKQRSLTSCIGYKYLITIFDVPTTFVAVIKNVEDESREDVVQKCQELPGYWPSDYLYDASYIETTRVKWSLMNKVMIIIAQYWLTATSTSTFSGDDTTWGDILVICWRYEMKETLALMCMHHLKLIAHSVVHTYIYMYIKRLKSNWMCLSLAICVDNRRLTLWVCYHIFVFYFLLEKRNPQQSLASFFSSCCSSRLTVEVRFVAKLWTSHDHSPSILSQYNRSFFGIMILIWILLRFWAARFTWIATMIHIEILFVRVIWSTCYSRLAR